MQLRISQRDLAREAGVHHSTVSRALKNDKRITAQVRAEIKAAAARLGYSPDPMLSSLAAYRNQKQVHQNQGTIAWLTNFPTRDGWKEFQNIDYFNGSSRRATELGYTLDDIWMREPGMKPERLTQILLSRNVCGILLPTQPKARVRLKLDWNKFTAVSFGSTVFWPPLRSVDCDHFRCMASLMRRVKKLGYRRPGFFCLSSTHEAVDRNWVAAFLTFQPGGLNDKFIPPLVEKLPHAASFKRWHQKYKPDVVIAQFEVVADWMRALGFRIPEDVGFALAAKHDRFSDFSGMDENSSLVGQAGVDLLVDLINRGERGIPSIPTTTLVRGSWIEGNSLRHQ